MQHQIELDQTDSRPINSVPYRAKPKEREFQKQEPDRLIAMGIIEPDQTEWAPPNSVHLEERQCNTVLHRLSKINCSDGWRIVPDTGHG